MRKIERLENIMRHPYPFQLDFMMREYDKKSLLCRLTEMLNAEKQ